MDVKGCVKEGLSGLFFGFRGNVLFVKVLAVIGVYLFEFLVVFLVVFIGFLFDGLRRGCVWLGLLRG